MIKYVIQIRKLTNHVTNNVSNNVKSVTAILQEERGCKRKSDWEKIESPKSMALREVQVQKSAYKTALQYIYCWSIAHFVFLQRDQVAITNQPRSLKYWGQCHFPMSWIMQPAFQMGQKGLLWQHLNLQTSFGGSKCWPWSRRYFEITCLSQRAEHEHLCLKNFLLL